MAFSIDIAEIRKLFETVDENGDERVTVTEMNRYLKRLGMEISGEDLKYLVIPLCESEDGSLTFDGFVGLCHSVFEERSEGEFSNGEIGYGDLMEAFKVYDTNNDGFISSTELQVVLCNLGFVEGEELAVCQQMICTYDSDSDGLLEFLEFRGGRRCVRLCNRGATIFFSMCSFGCAKAGDGRLRSNRLLQIASPSLVWRPL